MEKPLLVLVDHSVDDTTARTSASPTSTTGRHRFHSSLYGSRAYLFLFGLFLSSISIYKAAILSQSGEGGGSSQDILVGAAASEASQFAPLRLEQDNHKKSPTEPRAAAATTEATAKVVSPSVKETQERITKKDIDQPPPTDKPLNIVVLYADDWRHDDLGIASHGVVHTPFLDWLASHQAIRFTRNCVTTSVCWISRATLHTSQYYSRHKATRPKDNAWYQGWGDAFPEILKQMGYYVGHIGKWHSMDFDLIKKTYDFERMYYGKHWFPGKVTLGVPIIICGFASKRVFLIVNKFFPSRQNHNKTMTS